MIQITIIGSGNVAQHLIKAFSQNTLVEIVQVFARNKSSVTSLIDEEKIVSEFSLLKEVDLYIMAVSDMAVAEISKKLNFTNKLVVHTSGSLAMNVLTNANRKGVFYPLQSFSKDKEVNFLDIPICIEAENETDYKLLEIVAKSISHKVFKIDSKQRKALHVSAVFVNNFTNYLYQIGNDICLENQIDFEILKPLILETATKLNTLSPSDAQTGPAKRNDTETINAHLNFLTNNNYKEIYKLLTKSIIDHGKKL